MAVINTQGMGKGGAHDDIAPRFYTALMDTGATSTCISPKVARECRLQPYGKTPMIGATGTKDANVYQFLIGFFLNPQQDGVGTVTGNMQTMSVEGLEFDSSAAFDILLGRDILCQGSFTLSFDGHYLFSF